MEVVLPILQEGPFQSGADIVEAIVITQERSIIKLRITIFVSDQLQALCQGETSLQSHDGYIAADCIAIEVVLGIPGANIRRDKGILMKVRTRERADEFFFRSRRFAGIAKQDEAALCV